MSDTVPPLSDFFSSEKKARWAITNQKNHVLWLDPYYRDMLLDFYLEWQKLSNTEKQARRQQPDINLDELAQNIKESFETFATPENLKKMMIGQGEDENLANFLKLDDIYEIADPLKILIEAIDRENIADIEAIAFFIILNFNSVNIEDTSKKRNIEGMFSAVMKRYTHRAEREQEQVIDPTFAPEEETAARRQRIFASAVAPLAFNHTNSEQLSDATLAHICVAADFSSKHLNRNPIKKVLIRLYYAFLDATSHKIAPPNFRPFNKSLKTRITNTLMQRNKKIGDLKKTARQLHPERIFLARSEFYNPEKIAEAKRKLSEIRKERAIEEKENAPYTEVAARQLAIAKAQKIDLTPLEPFIEEKKKWLKKIKDTNEDIDQHNPRQRKVFYPTRTFDINVEIEALIAARLEIQRLKEQNRPVPFELADLLSQLDNIVEEPEEETQLVEQENKEDSIRKIPPLILAKQRSFPSEELKKDVEFALPRFATEKVDIASDSDAPRFEVVRVTVPKEAFYLIDNRKPLGSGAYGFVYQAYRINVIYDQDNTPQLDLNNPVDLKNPMVVKKIPASKTSDESIRKEIEASRQTANVDYIRITNYQNSDEDYHFLFSDFSPGIALSSKAIKELDLTLEEQLAAVVSLISEVANLHRRGFAHLDLNESNVLLHIGNNAGRKKLALRVIDLGEAEKISTNPNERIAMVRDHGAIGTMPPELFDENAPVGLKSDVFQLVWAIAVLLGAQRPGAERSRVLKEEKEYNLKVVNTPLVIDDILTDSGLPIELVTLVKKFINEKMQHLNYDNRHDIETCLKFFITFQNLVLQAAVEGSYSGKDTSKLWNELKRLANGGKVEVAKAQEMRPSPVLRSDFERGSVSSKKEKDTDWFSSTPDGKSFRLTPRYQNSPYSKKVRPAKKESLPFEALYESGFFISPILSRTQPRRLDSEFEGVRKKNLFEDFFEDDVEGSQSTDVTTPPESDSEDFGFGEDFDGEVVFLNESFFKQRRNSYGDNDVTTPGSSEAEDDFESEKETRSPSKKQSFERPSHWASQSVFNSSSRRSTRYGDVTRPNLSETGVDITVPDISTDGHVTTPDSSRTHVDVTAPEFSDENDVVNVTVPQFTDSENDERSECSM